MLPTTYSGEAVIDGQRLQARLHLAEDSVALALDNDEEVVRWPLRSLDVEQINEGAYELKHRDESFSFKPAVDDGLDQELQLRRRFAGEEDTSLRSKGSPPANAESRAVQNVSGRIASKRQHRPRRTSIIKGQDLSFRSALLALTVLAGLVLLVAVLSGSLEPQPTTVVVAESSEGPGAATASSTVPESDQTPGTDAPRTTTPPEVAPATVTTESPTIPTTQPPGSGTDGESPAQVEYALDMGPQEFLAAWDSLMRPISSSLAASDVTTSDDHLTFASGDFTEVEAELEQDGSVGTISLFGDPSGPVENDREILTALGAVLAFVEPDLEPEGRRQLLGALGLDIEDPDLDGLDNSLDYRGHNYSLRWDGDLERLVLDVRPSDDQTQDELAANEDDDS